MSESQNNRQAMLESAVACLKKAADDYVMPMFNASSRCEKADGSLVTEADLAVDRFVCDYLKQHWPDIDILSEEMPAQQRADMLAGNKSSFWCLDPLDGTTNYAAGAPYFALSLALVNQSGCELGIVLDPARQECFTAIKGGGAFLNGVPLTVQQYPQTLSKAIANIDLKRLQPPLLNKLLSNPPYYSQRNYGACALEFCWLALGRFHVYLHGGMKMWDYAAGHLILAESGGASCTLDGEPVYAPGQEKRSVVAACYPQLLKQWQDCLVL